MKDNGRKYWGPENQGVRHQTPERLREFESRYDMSSENIQDLVQRNPRPFMKYVLNLAVARAVTDPLILTIPGRGFVLYGFTTATIDTTQALAANVRVNVGVGSPNDEQVWVAKHNRGFRGDFEKLYLWWPAQENNSANFYVFNFDGHPFQCGEAAT